MRSKSAIAIKLLIVAILIIAMIYLPDGSPPHRSKEQRNFDLWLGSIEPALRERSDLIKGKNIILKLTQLDPSLPEFTIALVEEVEGDEVIIRPDPVSRLLSLIKESNLFSTADSSSCHTKCLKLSITEGPLDSKARDQEPASSKTLTFETTFSADLAKQHIQTALLLKLFETFSNGKEIQTLASIDKPEDRE